MTRKTPSKFLFVLMRLIMMVMASLIGLMMMDVLFVVMYVSS